MKQINSVQNPFIKSLVQLQDKSKMRRETGTFLIEGKREIELALQGNYAIETILFVAEMASISAFQHLDFNFIEISKDVYEKLESIIGQRIDIKNRNSRKFWMSYLSNNLIFQDLLIL